MGVMFRSMFGLPVAAVLSVGMAVAMASCAKETEVADPYANWEQRNSEFLDSIVNVCDNPPEGETWGKYFDYAIAFDKEPGDLMEPYIPKDEDYVYVKYRNAADKLTDAEVSANGGVYPIMYTDTVMAAYQGFLINGVRFDGTHFGTFDREVNDNFTKFGVNQVIKGWTIALLHLKPGKLPKQGKLSVADGLSSGNSSDENVSTADVAPFVGAKDAVEVYIPYQLAYGESGSGNSIPGKSVLKFELYVDEVLKQGHTNK